MRERECLWTPTDPRAMEQQCKLQILRVAKDLCTHSHSYIHTPTQSENGSGLTSGSELVVVYT